MLRNSYRNKIIEIFTDKAKFAFIFGSANTKYFNTNSDIDIAIYLKKKPDSVSKIIDLKYQAEKSFNFEHDIDLIILNDADIIITNQIITKGEIIIDNDPKFTNNFILSKRNMYLDFKFFRKNLEDNLKTKVL